ncbi:MAG: alkaline phosphatase family protein [Clostridia bacterium]|nr:alkaline phosphatase family protein [Clostridia bacterium]
MDEQIYNSISLTKTAATITSLLGVSAPESAAAPIDIVLKKANKAFSGEKADTVVMYNPDAVALWLYQKYTHLFSDVLENSSLMLPLESVMPSVTPVCFASMYTGAFPQVHGIQSYTKPVLKTDTVFDALIREGKKPVIISTSGDSISKIFLERKMDYFIFDSAKECNAKAEEVIKSKEYDLIVLYNGNYDGTMHREGPENELSLNVLKENAGVFAHLASLLKEYRKNENCCLFFAPDHGCHEIDGGCGSHGLLMPEDINIVHFYEFFPKTL